MKIAYLDVSSGLSGELILGALLHLRVSFDVLRGELAKLPLAGYRMRPVEHQFPRLRATQCRVETEGAPSEQTVHTLIRLVQESDLLPPVKDSVMRVLTVLTEAAGRVYGLAPTEVGSTQIGGVQAIVTSIGAVVGFHELGIDSVYASTLPLGTGRGVLRAAPFSQLEPVTVELLKGLRVCLDESKAGSLTPSGVAIVAALARQGLVPPLQLTAVGYGTGEGNTSEQPHLLRILVGNTSATLQGEELLVLETNIDDCNPELYDHVMERLFAAGARDVFLLPIQMKKNRPGVLLWVLCDLAAREALTTVIFSETSTLGIRAYPVARVALPRAHKEVDTPYGSVRVKLAYSPDGRVHVAPEYEDCRRLAREQNIPLKVVYEEAALSARQS
jgi:uncharacterized protein (TIGR00299 family) protein